MAMSGTSRFETVANVARRAPRILGVSAAAALVGYIALLPDSYEASTDIRLANGAIEANEVQRVGSPGVLAEAVSQLPPDLVASLRNANSDIVDSTLLLQDRLTISANADGRVINIRAVAGQMAAARTLADAVAAAYLAAAPSVDASEARLPAELGPASVADTPARALQNRMLTTFQQRLDLEERADVLDQLAQSGNFAAMAAERPEEPVLAQRLHLLGELEAERDELSVRLLPNHPTMRGLNEQIAILNGQLRSAAQEMAAAARASLNAVRQTEASLQAQLDGLPTALEANGVDRVTTAAIGNGARQLAPAIARPQAKLVGPELGGALGGSMALLTQLGLLALRRPRSEDETALDDAWREDEPEEPELPFASAADEDDAPSPLETALSEMQAEAEAELPPENPKPQAAGAFGWLRKRVSGFAAPVVEAEPELELEPAVEELPPVEPAPVAAAEPIAEPAPVVPDEIAEAAPVVPDEITEDVVPQPKPKPASRLQERVLTPAPGLVVIVAEGQFESAKAMADDLHQALRHKGNRVAIVDAASRRRSSFAGISDLAQGRASFADVVQFADGGATVRVSWGRRASLDLECGPAHTLVLALRELNDVVIVIANRAGAEGLKRAFQAPEELLRAG
jgi:hypothetical protein